MNTISSVARRLAIVSCCFFAGGCCTYNPGYGPLCTPSCNPLDCVACKVVEIAVLNGPPAQEVAPEATPAGPQAY